MTQHNIVSCRNLFDCALLAWLSYCFNPNKERCGNSFLSKEGKAYLLPMRVAGFAKLVREVQAKTGIDTTDVKPLAQPWMYLILLGFTLLLLLVDAWTITTAIAIAAV